MSGLLALLDDVAAIAKVAAASVDDIATAAAKAGSKTAAVLIDDAAVTPKYVTGFEAKRELPIIGRIALGSIKNKILILLPLALLLQAFAPWLLTPLLMIGGAYLCFEGAEKVLHWLFPHASHEVAADLDVQDPGKLEEERVAGAIKTDFILSAEIMTIAMSNLELTSIWQMAFALALIAVGVTAAVYGAVAVIVKMDDVGMFLAQRGRLGATQGFGRFMVRSMPKLLWLLSTVGTFAMLWVGGSIITHGLDVLGFPWAEQQIHHLQQIAVGAVPQAAGFVAWLVKAIADGIVGLILGIVLIPVASKVINPLFKAIKG